MKRFIIYLLVIVMALSLCACGKSEAVKAAEEAINNIGNVTLDSESVIKNAEKLYNVLTDAEKAEVENRLTLVDAREAYDALLEEQAEAKKESIYQNAKESFNTISSVADLCVAGMDDLYNTWYFAIYDAEDCTKSNIYSEMANETSFTSEELMEAIEFYSGFDAYDMGGVLIKEWQYCIYTIETAFMLRGDYGTIENEMAAAQDILQELTTVYDDYTYYPKLKDYYSAVSSYVDFFLNPTGSFQQLADTINNYENTIRTYRSDIGFLFTK